MAIEEVFIDDISKLNDLFFRADYQATTSRHRDLRLYRGLCNSSYNLITSLRRNCKNLDATLEKNILDNFGKYAAIEDPQINNSIWRKMFLGQHHGLPTRLLDWTRSPLIALHFAMTEGNMDLIDQHDCVIWELDVKELHSALPENYQEVMKNYGQNIFSIEMLIDACHKEDGDNDTQIYDKDMGKDKMVIVEPPSIDPRIMNQYSFFSVVPTGVEKVEDILEHYPNAVKKYIISKNLRWQIRDMLDQANINERIIYPGLDGIATWIGRHYFVRDTNRIRISKIDITHLDVDAIVNTTNESLKPIGAVCKHIFDMAGYDELVDECKTIGHCDTGSSIVTSGYKLKAKHIIHTVAPMFDYSSDYDKSLDTLRASYLSALKLAVDNNWCSIAFPLLCSGASGLDDYTAWDIGLNTCIHFLNTHKELSIKENKNPLDITFCVIDEKQYQLGESIRKTILGYKLSSQDVKLLDLKRGNFARHNRR